VFLLVVCGGKKKEAADIFPPPFPGGPPSLAGTPNFNQPISMRRRKRDRGGQKHRKGRRLKDKRERKEGGRGE